MHICSAFSGVETDTVFAATEEHVPLTLIRMRPASQGPEVGGRHQARNVSFSSGESQPRPRATGDSKRLMG